MQFKYFKEKLEKHSDIVKVSLHRERVTIILKNGICFFNISNKEKMQ